MVAPRPDASDYVSDVQDPTARGKRLKAQWLPTATLLAVFGLATVLLTVLGILGLHGGTTEGMSLVLVLVLMIGLAIAISVGFEGWLPALFGLSLLASLNFTLERIPLTLYAFDPFLVVLYCAWLGRAYQGKARPLRLSPLDGLGLAWIAWLMISSLLGQHVPTSLNGWLLYARGFLIYFYFSHALQARWQLRALVAVLVGMVALQSGLGLLQYLTRSNIGSISDLVGGTVGSVRQVGTVSGSLFRVRGTLNTDTSLAHWLEMLVPLSLSLWLSVRLRWQRLLLGLIVLAGAAAQVVTFTRGGWFGVAAGVILVLWLQFRSRLVIRRQLLAALTAVVLLALSLLPFAGLIRARLFESEQNTLAVRENLNRTALEVIVDHPITGIGLDNFVRVAPEYGTGWRWLMEGKSHKVHNVYLALASETGPIGLLLFLVLMGGVILIVWRGVGRDASEAPWHWTALARGLLAGIAAVLVHGLAAWGLLSYGVFPLFWMLLGLAAQYAEGGLGEAPWAG